jgi:hypothetical protein
MIAPTAPPSYRAARPARRRTDACGDGDALVPILGGHLFAGVAIIAAALLMRTVIGPKACRALSIAARKPAVSRTSQRSKWLGVSPKPACTAAAAFAAISTKATGSLLGKGGNDGSANAAAAAGHEDDAARKGRIDGVRTWHGRPPVADNSA